MYLYTYIFIYLKNNLSKTKYTCTIWRKEIKQNSLIFIPSRKKCKKSVFLFFTCKSRIMTLFIGLNPKCAFTDGGIALDTKFSSSKSYRK